MEYVAYNYFETPSEDGINAIASEFMQPSFDISHASKKDPPKRFVGSEIDLRILFKDSSDLTNYTFVKSRSKKLEVTIEIHNDPRWEHSTISIGGPSKELVENLCVPLNNVVNSYLCIAGISGLGPKQKWSFLHKSSKCPQTLLKQVSNA